MTRIKLFKFKSNVFDMELDKIRYDEVAKLQVNLSDEELKVQVATNGIKKFKKWFLTIIMNVLGKILNLKWMY